MNQRLFFFSLILFCALSTQAQVTNTPDLSKGGYVFVGLDGDTVRYREKAALTLRMLKGGSVVVRLKVNQKSIDAYRKDGRTELADKIERDNTKRNLDMYNSFKRNFTFCRVYFIYATDTKKFLSGDKNVFLNEKLQYDSSIIPPDSNFVFCEYGTVESYSRYTDQSGFAVDKPSIPGNKYTGPNPHTILDTVTRRTSTGPATTSGLAFYDKNLEQFQRPFPYVEGVYLNNFSATIRTLNNEMERAYNRLVTTRDFRLIVKAERKKQKETKKKGDNLKYNPFK